MASPFDPSEEFVGVAAAVGCAVAAAARYGWSSCPLACACVAGAARITRMSSATVQVITIQTAKPMIQRWSGIPRQTLKPSRHTSSPLFSLT
jgi:hypothetical protein